LKPCGVEPKRDPQISQIPQTETSSDEMKRILYRLIWIMGMVGIVWVMLWRNSRNPLAD
jgi:hypothetical protein